MTGLTTQLGRLLGDIGRGEVPVGTLDAARTRVFHAFGVSLMSSVLPPAGIAWRAVGSVRGDCFVFGRSERAAADDAALVNGVIGHSSLQEDCGPGGLSLGSHPSTYIIPAALAAAESIGASGRQLMLGIVAGYEAVGRIGELAPSDVVRRKFRPVGVMGPFGAAAAAAVIYGGTDAHIAAALDIAANVAGGSTQGIFDGTMEPYLHAGFAARNGLMAARLALAGIVTSAHSLEGEFGFFQTYGGSGGDPGELAKQELAITQLGTKRFAACLQNQLTMALIVEALPAGVPAERVVRAVVRRPATGTNGLNSPGVSRLPPFENMLTAQMSARFTAAAALLGHAVDDPGYFQAAYGDEQVTSLAGRIDLVPGADDTVVVELHLSGGEPIVLRHDGPSSVLFPSAAEVREAFLRRGRPALGAQVNQAASLLDGLENLPDVREVTAALTPV